ncbi:MAG: hypothetical protein M1834_008398 [Cirrosporium novae-zelandiae]|nr:MAG: hypothetical protein M1834_008398 [Cirrosporium novae-zelandiae]
MTAHIHRAPTPLQPRLKAPPTASSAHLDALVTKSTASSQPPSPTKSHTPVSRSATLPVDTSDRATAALIRRVLCPANSYQDNRNTPRPIEDLLPPLTSSNEIDLQLYAIIAIVLKEYVYSWYGRITPDRVFVDEIVQLIAHCTRALEERLRKVDLELLLFDEIPALVEAHVVAYRAAHRPFHPPQLASDPRHIYHTLNPHPALSPVPDPSIPESIEEEQVNETAYRQLLVQGTLAVLLPTEDLENAPLRTLVGDVLADLIIGSGIAGKLCEGWFIWSSIIKAVEIHSQKAAPEHSVESKESQLEKCGLLPSVSTEKNKGSSAGSKVPSWRISIVLWQVLQYCYLTLVVFRFVVVGLFQAGTIPSRQTWVGTVSASTTPPTKTPIEGSFNPSRIGSGRRRPILAYRLFSLVSTLLDLSTRMPWLAGILSLVQHQVIDGPGQVGDTDGIVDR